jgi:hypothetical protein
LNLARRDLDSRARSEEREREREGEGEAQSGRMVLFERARAVKAGPWNATGRRAQVSDAIGIAIVDGMMERSQSQLAISPEQRKRDYLCVKQN